jgi:LAS superfamily LD-carboxypeptidase LdcB
MSNDFDERIRRAETEFFKILDTKKPSRYSKRKKQRLLNLNDDSYQAIKELAQDAEEAGIKIDQIIDNLKKD